MRSLLLAVASLCLSCGGSQTRPAPVPKATLAFTHVRVFDGERVLVDQDVLVDGTTIVAVGSNLGVPAGATVVDGTGKTLLPGLIDAHVHVHDAAALEQALVFGVTRHVLEPQLATKVARRHGA